MANTSTSPPPGAQGPEDHREIALRSLKQARRALNSRSYRQAELKAWAAVAHQSNAIALERGWDGRDGSKFLYDRIVRYLRKEYALDSDTWSKLRGASFRPQDEFYGNSLDSYRVKDFVKDARFAVTFLEDLRRQPLRSYTIENESDQRLVETLTGWQFDVFHTRAEGFVSLPPPPVPPSERGREQHFPWKDYYPNDPDIPNRGYAAARYREQAREFLGGARQYLSDGDMREASSKGWYAARYMAKAVADAMGESCTCSEDFWRVVSVAGGRLGQRRSILRLARSADALLHCRYYDPEERRKTEDISDDLGDVAELLDLLEPLTLR